MTDEIYETPSTTPNFQTELAAQLADLIPEAIADGKVDVEKLKELLDGDATDGSERFGLFWPGKKRALRAAQEPTTATLKPDFDNSKDWETTQNVFIEGDNLEVLKILQKHYHAKIKLIYIDPPYNTGKDFVYPDNYKEGLDTYLEWTRQVNEEGKKVTTNAETEGRYHSNWLNMMYPRLKLARNLLTDDGVIFVSIGDQELANLQRVMFEVFGEANALPLFTRVTKKSSNNGTTFSPSTDYVVGFARNIARLRPFSVPLTDEQVKSYNRSDERGAYKEIGLFQAALKHGGSRYAITAPDGQRVITPRDLPWRWSEAKLREGLAADQIVFKKTSSSPLLDADTGERAAWNVYTKLHLADREEAGLLPKNYSDELQNNLGTRDLRDLNLPFDFPKPVALVKFLASIINDPAATVLDLFGGSGTTAQAVMELNVEDGGTRRHILVQLPEPVDEGSDAASQGFRTIADIARTRVVRAGNRIADAATRQLQLEEHSVDLGFRSYKLADTSFSKWRLSSDVEEDALQQHLLSLRDSSTDDATADELLTEILLKQGYSLTEAVSPAEIGGLDVRLVRDRDGDVAVLAYLNEHVKPTLGQLRALVDESPTRIIVLEDAFQGDDELKTNLAQLAKSNGIELWTA
ncbi:site-specific DNA-methyltransferase [Pseudoclavibacter helvolus]|uniref:site-specific DNA-methyltransferase n=1 Tax=Pseudoclavibacter helvolus TaxID=255205 RepID=UPI003735ACFC